MPTYDDSRDHLSTFQKKKTPSENQSFLDKLDKGVMITPF